MWARAREGWLLATATAVRLSVAAYLRILPYRFWQPLLVAAMRPENGGRQEHPDLVARVVWAVGSTERIVPAGRCLERALTAWLMLHRRVPCRVRMGANLDAQGKLFAHAWLEVGGQVVLGASGDPLAPLGEPGDFGDGSTKR